MQRSAGLDLMRALAITLVLLHHFLHLVYRHSPWVFPFFNWGLIGVDIFFALSGFLIGRILLKLDLTVARPRELLRFWARRWWRTLPIYYVILLGRISLAFVMLRLWLHLDWKYWHNVPSYFVFLQSWAWRVPPFFNETWSLAVEEWFYLLFPLLWAVVSFCGMKPRRAFVLVSIFMLLAATFARLAAMPMTPQGWLNDTYTVTICRLDNIAFGLLGAVLSVTCPWLWRRGRWLGLAFGLALLWVDRRLMIVGLMRQDNGYLGVWHCTVTGLGSALLLPWCSSVEKLFWRPFQNLIGLISRWSYALYLTHGAFIVSVELIFASQIKQSTAWAWGIVMVTTGLTFVLAGIVHRWVEKPGMAFRERWKFTRHEQTPVFHGQTLA
jgi:peptidoglycan/LPS O-acetylase OafA/YrhL